MDKIIIADASSLILLQKIALLDKLVKNFKFIIPPAVYNEAVTKGQERKSDDSYKLAEKINKNFIAVKRVSDKNKIVSIINKFDLAQGESEAIALFLQEKVDVLATDDHKAINVCKIYGIPFITALAFVLESFGSKLIDKAESKEMIQKLSVYGRYRDELIYKAINFVEGKND